MAIYNRLANWQTSEENITTANMQPFVQQLISGT